MAENKKHKWPADGEHFWSPWKWFRGLPNPEESRFCIHPDCGEVQTRPGARG